MRAGDGVEVPGEVQVDIVHRQHLCVAAAGRTAFDAEHRTQAGLAHAEYGVVPNAAKRLRQPDADRALAFTRRGGADGRDQH